MSDEEYTPSTIEVLCRYQEWAGGTASDQAREHEFDRWLRERDAEKWDQGFMECANWWEIHHAQSVLATLNPYRTEPHE